MTPGVAPVVIKQFLPVSQFSNSSGAITMGPLTLTGNSVKGTVNNITVDVVFKLDGRSMHFIPPVMFEEFPFLPNFQAHYGSLVSGTVNGTTYAPRLPFIFCNYPILIGVQYWEWILMTGLHYEGTDLQVQVVGTNVLGLWVATSYVRYRGKEYHLNNPVLLETQFYNLGKIVDNKTLIISATVEPLFSDLSLDVSCSAPLDKFALLGNEGSTAIHTTVLGSCVAKDKRNNLVWKTKSDSLMELKRFAPLLAAN